MKFLMLLGPVFFLSCASKTTDVKKNHTAQFENYLINNKCEEAEAQIPVEKDESRFIRFYNGTLGHLVYLGTTPVTIGIDILLMARCNLSDCRVKPDKWLQEAFPLSVYTHENTKEFRCPDTGYYVNKVIEISKCYEDRGDKVLHGS